MFRRYVFELGLDSNPKTDGSVHLRITACACCATRAKGYYSFKRSVANVFKAHFENFVLTTQNSN